jgi:S1/P1 Nuclease
MARRRLDFGGRLDRDARPRGSSVPATDRGRARRQPAARRGYGCRDCGGGEVQDGRDRRPARPARGGNDVHVMFMGRSTNLHQVWDTGVLANAGIKDERAFALSLARSISPAAAEKWRSGTPADWADDSYGVASDLIYGVWPHGPGDLPASYEQKAIYVVQVQLEKAGVRLAAALNTTLP